MQFLVDQPLAEKQYQMSLVEVIGGVLKCFAND